MALNYTVFFPISLKIHIFKYFPMEYTVEDTGNVCYHSYAGEIVCSRVHSRKPTRIHLEYIWSITIRRISPQSSVGNKEAFAPASRDFGRSLAKQANNFCRCVCVSLLLSVRRFESPRLFHPPLLARSSLSLAGRRSRETIVS